MVTFAERAEAMGLTLLSEGVFGYSDQYGHVSYREVKDALRNVLPIMAVYTKGLGDTDEWKYTGHVSTSYKFMGNDRIIQKVRDSITEHGTPSLNETTTFNPMRTMIYNEIVLDHANNVPAVGDINPIVTIENSYGGTRAGIISFGFMYMDTEGVPQRFSFKQKLGQMKEIHIEGSNTSMAASVGNYINVFDGHIADVLSENMTNMLSPDDMMRTLDMVEDKAGKKMRVDISKYLQDTEAQEGIESWAMSGFKMFQALVRHSSLSGTINGKNILENLAERVLVVPGQMYETLEALNIASAQAATQAEAEATAEETVDPTDEVNNLEDAIDETPHVDDVSA